MAKIRDLKLQLVDRGRRNGSADIRVTYQAELTLRERQFAGLRFKEKIQLCSARSLDPEDFLYELATQTFTGKDSRIVNRERTATVCGEILDETGRLRPPDQVFARVWVTPVLPEADFETSEPLARTF
jgi:hypothetical protein